MIPNNEEMARINCRHLENKKELATKMLLGRLYYEVKMLREMVKQTPPVNYASAHCPQCFRDFPHSVGNYTATKCCIKQTEWELEELIPNMELFDGTAYIPMPLDILGSNVKLCSFLKEDTWLSD